MLALFMARLTPEIVRIGTQLFTSIVRHQKIVFEPQASTTVPIYSGLDGEHHAGAHLAGSDAVRIGRLMSACSDAVRDWVRWLARVAGRIDPIANDAVDFAKRGAIADATNGISEYLEQLIEQAIVFGS
jgi:hypothetical protein